MNQRRSQGSDSGSTSGPEGGDLGRQAAAPRVVQPRGNAAVQEALNGAGQEAGFGGNTRCDRTGLLNWTCGIALPDLRSAWSPSPGRALSGEQSEKPAPSAPTPGKGQAPKGRAGPTPKGTAPKGTAPTGGPGGGPSPSDLDLERQRCRDDMLKRGEKPGLFDCDGEPLRVPDSDGSASLRT